MKKLRYLPTENMEEILDCEKNECLYGTVDIATRLNKQESIIRQKQNQIDAMVNLFNKELENADGELKEVLIKLSQIPLEV